MDSEDEIISVLPVYYSDALAPNLQIHQFPLLVRPLRVPPSAALSGKRIKARLKPNSRRLEIQLPADTRAEVYNPERSAQLGAAREEDDRDKNQANGKGNSNGEQEHRLSEIRLRSEQVVQKGAHVMGIVRDGKLHLHPISETHQIRPTQTYLDVLSRKNKRSRHGGDSDSDSDDGPPPDPDEPPAVQERLKKEKSKSTGESKEVHVMTRKSDDQGHNQGGMSAVRREMLHIIRSEEDEEWENLLFCEVSTEESSRAIEALFARNEGTLDCTTDQATFIKSINGL